MEILIIGYLNDVALTYLNLYTANLDDTFICIDNKTENEYSNLEFSNIIIYKEEININLINKILVEHEIDKVINFYQLEEGRFSLDEYNKHNYEFVVDLYELCNKNNIFLIHMSTNYVYGNSNYTYRNENDSLIPTTHYIASKINADTFLKNKDVCVLRLGDTFGCLYENSYINCIIKSLLNNKQVIIHEQEEFLRSYIYTVDCSYILNYILNNEIKGIYNLNSEYYVKAKDLLNKIISYFDYNEEILYTTTKQVHILVVKTDQSLLETTTKYKITKQKEKLEFFLQQCTIL